ncbi:hypothetical protein D3C75_1291090 [compost metagenome]
MLAASSLPLTLTSAALQSAPARKQMLYCVSDSSPSRGPITKVVIAYPSMISPMQHSETGVL